MCPTSTPLEFTTRKSLPRLIIRIVFKSVLDARLHVLSAALIHGRLRLHPELSRLENDIRRRREKKTKYACSRRRLGDRPLGNAAILLAGVLVLMYSDDDESGLPWESGA